MMLILTRRKGQKILINKGQIEILVIYQKRGTVSLGIKAPSHMDVIRDELLLRKQPNSEPIKVKEQK